MSPLTLLAIAFGMSMDVFSVSMAVAAGPRTRRQAFRLWWHFGLFQFLMPLAGWGIGRSIVDLIAGFDHWIAFGMLAAVGGHMILEGTKPPEEKSTADRSRGWSLVILSVATSIDALGVGLGLGVIGSSIVFPALVIGVVSGAMSLAGYMLGRRLRSQFGHRMEIAGGLALVAIGVKLLLDGLGAR